MEDKPKLTKSDIIAEYNSFLKTFKLQPEEFIIGAGGALLMYGLRDTTSDIDAAISNELFDKLLKTKKYNLSYFGDTEVIKYNNKIDLHRLVRKFETTIINGVCCYSLNELLKQKEELNRPKDQEDIKELKKLIKIYEEIPKEILDAANNDKFLKDTIYRDIGWHRTPITYHGKIVGFYTPRTKTWDNKLYYRTGAIYVLPKYRKKGLASKAIKEYFKDKERGFAYIEPNNEASIALFESIGFKKTEKMKIESDIYWIMIKDETITSESLFESISKPIKLFLW